MKKLLVILFCTVFSYAFSQQKDSLGTLDLSFGVTAYPYFYSTNFKNITSAVGLSLFLPEKRFSLQAGFLYDLKTYADYGYISSGSIYYNHGQLPTYKAHNIFILLLGHYSYYNNNITSLFVTGGFVFGGPYYIDENNFTQKGNSDIDYLFGTGIKHEIIKKLYLRVCPNLRYNHEKLMPGLLIDLSFRTHIS